MARGSGAAGLLKPKIINICDAFMCPSDLFKCGYKIGAATYSLTDAFKGGRATTFVFELAPFAAGVAFFGSSAFGFGRSLLLPLLLLLATTSGAAIIGGACFFKMHTHKHMHSHAHHTHITLKTHTAKELT